MKRFSQREYGDELKEFKPNTNNAFTNNLLETINREYGKTRKNHRGKIELCCKNMNVGIISEILRLPTK